MAATDSGVGQLAWGATTSAAPYLHALMTDYFTPVIHNARNNQAAVLSLIPKDSRFFGGKFIIEPVEFGRNHKSFNAVGDDGRFPDPGVDKARIYAYRSRQQFGRFIIGGKLLRAAGYEPTRYVDPIQRTTKRWTEDYLVDKARQMWSDGSGRLAEVSVTPGAGSPVQMTLRVNQDIATGMGAPGASASGAPDWPPTMYLAVGMRVAFVTSGGTFRCIGEVTSIDSSTLATFMFVLAIAAGADFNACGVVATDWIVKIGNATAGMTNALALQDSAFKNEPMGLGGILGYAGVLDGHGPAAEVGADLTAASLESAAAGYTAYTWSGTDAPGLTTKNFFQGLAALSTAPGWEGDLTFNQGLILHNSGSIRTPTENLIQRAYSALRKLNNARINVLVSSYELRDTFAETLLGEKRYVNTVDMKGGWDSMLPGPEGIPWVCDLWAPHNQLTGLSLEDGGFLQYIIEPLSWATEEGANIWQYLQDYDRYQARLVEDYNVGIGVRNRCGFRILDLRES